MLSFLVLLAVTLGWFLLPIIPAILELVRPTDVQPLQVVDRSAGEVDFFARNFRQYFEKQIAAHAALPAGERPRDALPDGTRFIQVRAASDAGTGNEDRLVVVESQLALPGDETFLVELYARAPLTGGPRAVYRAIYGERELTLGEGSRVLRWAHAAGRFSVGAHSVLQGRISSDRIVSLGGGVIFERIGAPVIAMGTENEPPPEPPALAKEFVLPEGACAAGDHFRIEGDLNIPGGVRVNTSLVVGGSVIVGLGTVVEGSIKAHRDVELADEARVRGSVVARRRVMTGAAAWIGGPVIAEQRIRLGRGTVVGGPNLPATVSAPEVELSQGVTVYGQISAPKGGRTF